MWIIGLLRSSGSSVDAPEPVRIAFRGFSNINDSRTCTALSKSLQQQAGFKTSVDSIFNFTEWWEMADGEKLSEPFDIGEELVLGLLHVLETVSTLFYISAL